MSSGSGPNRGNASRALLPFEKKALQEARSYASACKINISDEKADFTEKGWWGLWCDAKGFFNSSDKEEVTTHMEKYREIYEEIDAFTEKVEKGDTNGYEELIDIYDKLETAEKDAESDVKNSQSKAVCRMLRKFLDEKYKLDHNVKKVECVVLRQQIRAVEQAHQSSRDECRRLNQKMDRIIDENRDVLEKMKEKMASEASKRSRESEERLKQVLKESEERFREMRRENDEVRLEAERSRVESEERLKKAVEEADKKSESRMRKMAEKSDAAMRKITKMLEDMSAAP